MYIEQIYTGSLSQAAYYVESGGEAAVIDPMLDVKPYIDLAAKRGVTIRYIFETHFHADFISGHNELSRITGAEIIFGPGAVAGYKMRAADDGDMFHLGFITLKLLHTPGHTPESCSLLLLDERNIPHSVFTGDTLFVDDVGRPDLAVSSNVNMNQMAGMLYDSIESKLLSLPNYVIVYPGHGAGSACGKSIGTELHTTIGMQKQSNYALKANSREEFIKLVTDGLNNPPRYFSRVAAMNKNGYSNPDALLKGKLKPYSAIELKSLLDSGNVLLLDTRSAETFAKGFIPGSVFIGLEGALSAIAGSILDPSEQIIIVADHNREQDVVTALARVGFENVKGYLEGGFPAWIKSGEPIDHIDSVSAEDFELRFRYNAATVIDVRNPDEWVPGFVAGAKLISLSSLENKLNEIDRNKISFVYCAAGFRAMVAASLLKKNGFDKVVNISGGIMKIRKTQIPIKQLSANLR